MRNALFVLLSTLLINSSAIAGDGAGLPSISKCKYYMDNIVEVFHLELTGANANVSNTRDMRIETDRTGSWTSIEGVNILDDGFKYYAKVTPNKGSCFLTKFSPKK